MKAKINTKELEKKVAIAMKGVASKTTLPILTCIILHADGDTIYMESTDLEIGVRVYVNGIVEESGTVALEAKLFAEIVRKLPEEMTVLKTDNKNGVFISSGKVRMKMVVKDHTSFPGIPDMEHETGRISVSQPELKYALNGILFSLADSSSNHSLMEAVNIKNVNGKLRFTALDGHRIAIRMIHAECIDENVELNIHGSTLHEIKQLMSSNKDETVTITYDDKLALFVMEGFIITSRLMDGDYYSIDNMFDREFISVSNVNKVQLSESIERAMLLLTETNKRPVLLDVQEDHINVSISTTRGDMTETVPAELMGKPISIAFNAKFIIDVLKVIDDEYIKLGLKNNNSPCIISGEEYDYLILPVNIK